MQTQDTQDPSSLISYQQARVLGAETVLYTAQLAYDIAAAGLDVAARALSEARTHWMTEQAATNLVQAQAQAQEG